MSRTDAAVDRIGVLGGSFNPPHRGHLALAHHAREELGLRRVLLMPARISPGKSVADDPGSAHRLEMCRLMVAGLEGLRPCAMEIEREGPSYTVDTVRGLHAAHPDIEITFVLGADVARTLPAWHRPRELLALAQLAVALRPGTDPAEVRRAVASIVATPERRLAGRQSAGPPMDPQSRDLSMDRRSGDPPMDRQPDGLPMSFLSAPAIDVSSSLVRDRVRRGLPVDDLVGSAVASYISEHRLYRAPGAAELA